MDNAKRFLKVTVEDERGVVKVLEGDFGIVAVGVVEDDGDKVGHNVSSSTCVGHPMEIISLSEAVRKALMGASEDVVRKMVTSLVGGEPEECDRDCANCKVHKTTEEVQ